MQEQGHVDAELLLKQRQNTSGFGQPTGTDCPTKTLTRLIGERYEQLIQAMFLQRLNGCDSSDSSEAEIQAVQTDAKRLSHGRNLNLVTEMLAEIVQNVGHHLHRAFAAAGDRLIDLSYHITCSPAGLTFGNHSAESRETGHAFSPPSRLHGHIPLAALPER